MRAIDVTESPNINPHTLMYGWLHSKGTGHVEKVESGVKDCVAYLHYLQNSPAHYLEWASKTLFDN